MPDRFLREGLIRSDRYNALSLDARDLFVRLIVIVDDFGVFDGRENVIAHSAYYHGRAEALALRELHEQHLIVRYLNGGRPYLAVMQWGEHLRLRRTYPAPPINVDRPDVNVRGKFGRTVLWKNPPGTDAVSVLLDLMMRPVAPQPPEWRRVADDWSPVTAAGHYQSLPQGTGAAPSTLPQRPAAGPENPVPQGTSRNVVPVPLPLQELKQSQESSPELRALPQGTATTAAAAAAANNGKVELLDNGEWRGLADAQVLRWQDMFPSLKIPDELAHAGAWLLEHREERKVYEQRGELGEYLIRWLLREARPRQQAS